MGAKVEFWFHGGDLGNHPYIASTVTAPRLGDLPPVDDAPVAKLLARGFRCRAAMSRIMSSRSVHAIHTNDSRMHLIWRIATQGSDVQHIVHFRTPPSRRAQVMACSAFRVAANSQATLMELKPSLRESTIVVERPFDLPSRRTSMDVDAAPSTSSNGPQPDRPLRVGYVSNLLEHKNPRLFVETARYILDSINRRHVRFFMVGRSDTSEGIRTQRLIDDLGLADVVMLVGSQVPVQPWLESFDVLVHPVAGHGFDRVIVEALLCGVPVVCMKVPDGSLFLKDGISCMEVSTLEPSELAAKVLLLLRSSVLRARLSEGAASLSSTFVRRVNRQVEHSVGELYRGIIHTY